MQQPAAQAILRILAPLLAVAAAAYYLRETLVGLDASAQFDFPSFYHAVAVAFRGRGNPYDAELLARSAGGSIFPFLYPPPSLFLFAPMALMAKGTARLAFHAANHAGVLLSLVLVLRCIRAEIGEGPRWRGALLCAYFLASGPLIVQMRQGQSDVILLVLLAAAWLAIQKGWEVAFAVLAAAAISLKLYPAVALPLLVAAGAPRLAAKAAAATAAAALASAIALPAALKGWLGIARSAGGYLNEALPLGSPAMIYNQSLNGLFSRLFLRSEWGPPLMHHPDLGRAAMYATAAAILAAAASALQRRRRAAGRPVPGSALLVALPTMFLLGNIAWEHHVVYVWPAVAAMLARSLEPRCSWHQRAGRWLAAALLFPAGKWQLVCPGMLAVWAYTLSDIAQAAASCAESASREDEVLMGEGVGSLAG